MDVIFQKVSGWSAAFDVVKQAKIEPYRHGKNGELLIVIDEIDEKANVEHQTGSSSNDIAASTPAMFISTDEENQRRQKE